MINRELIEVFSEIAREKNVERSELANILEELFLYVIEKEYGDSSNCSCIVNLDKGEIEIYSEKSIVEEVDDQKVEITLADAISKEPDAADELAVGDIFVAKIRKTIPGLNAAFINVGHEKDGFLQYHDLGPKLLSLSKFVEEIDTKKVKSFSFSNKLSIPPSNIYFFLLKFEVERFNLSR